MIRYFKLFAYLTLRGMKKTDLLEVISSPTLAKLSKGETVKTDVIDRICLFLECQPEDIMECVENVEKVADGIEVYTTKESADNYIPMDRVNRKISIEYENGVSRVENVGMDIIEQSGS